MKSCKQRSELCKLPNVESVKPHEIQVAFAQAKLDSSNLSTCSGSTQLSVHDWAGNDLMLFISDVPHCIQTAVIYFIGLLSPRGNFYLLNSEARKATEGVFSHCSPCLASLRELGASQKHKSHCYTKTAYKKSWSHIDSWWGVESFLHQSATSTIGLRWQDPQLQRPQL